MLLNQVLLLTTLTMMLLGTREPVEAAESLPGCPNKCGSLDIPYPFGTRKGCYLSKEYKVDCKKQQISKTNFKSLDISADGYMHGLIPLGYRCYKNHVVTKWSEPKIDMSRFHISNKGNLLTAVGCDTRADIKTTGGEGYIIGSLSMSYCDQVKNGSCVGMGCNQVPVPYRMRSFRINAQSNTGQVGKWRYNNCTYAFVVKKGNYTFLKTDIYNMQNRSFPVLLEWWVGNESCKKAQKEKMGCYICRENSVCHDIVYGSKKLIVGYRCKCAHGYQGNAYIPNGCKGKAICV